MLPGPRRRPDGASAARRDGVGTERDGSEPLAGRTRGAGGRGVRRGAGAAAAGGAGRMRIAAMPTAHSHAFQRGLRGRAERSARGGGSGARGAPPGAAPAAGGPSGAPPATDDFWSWREAMYALAGGLDPDSTERAGRAAYDEMASAGYGAVGEFHYVHHRPDGSAYDDPNAMAKATARAARAAGLRIVLLPAAYARAGPGRPPEPRQRRFCDPSAAAFLARVEQLRDWARAET